MCATRRRPRSDVLTILTGGALFVLGARAARQPQVGRREEQWFGWMNRLPSRWFVPVWLVMQIGSLGGVIVTTAVVGAAGRPALARRMGGVGVFAWIAAKAVKRFIGRGRPTTFLTQARVLGREQTGLGYPSGHAAVTAAMAVAAAGEAIPSLSAAVWLVPLAVGSSRIYVGAHLPLDVGGGFALGVVCGTLVRIGVPHATSRGGHPTRPAVAGAGHAADRGRSRHAAHP